MKDFTEIIKKAFRNHTFIVLTAVSFICALVDTIIASVNIHIVGFQVYIHYSAYAGQGYFSDKWYYLITFIIAPLLIWILNTLIAARVFYQKNRQFATLVQALTISILLIALMIYLVLFKVIGMQM